MEIFSPTMLKTTILTSMLATGAQGGYYAIATWLPTYLRTERKLTVLGTGGYLAVIIVGSFIGYLVSAYLADRIGRRANFILFAVCSVLTVFVYTQLPVNDTMMLILGFPLGFFASGIFSGMGAFLTENFPTRVRGSGQGFAYNFGRGVAALNPFFVGVLSATLPLGQSIGIFAVIAYGILICCRTAAAGNKGTCAHRRCLIRHLASAESLSGLLRPIGRRRLRQLRRRRRRYGWHHAGRRICP